MSEANFYRWGSKFGLSVCQASVNLSKSETCFALYSILSRQLCISLLMTLISIWEIYTLSSKFVILARFMASAKESMLPGYATIVRLFSRNLIVWFTHHLSWRPRHGVRFQ